MLSEFDQEGITANNILSLQLQTFTYCIKNQSQSCESQERSPSHHFTGESEQTINTNFPLWNPREKGRRLDDVTWRCCSWRSAFW